MDMRLQPFDFQRAVARAGVRLEGLEPTRPTRPADGTGAVQGGGFQDAMAKALNSVSQAQVTASKMQTELSMDNPQVSLEETMVAMQKAQVGFQAVIGVRNRLVQAYTEIMNMQV